MNNERKAYTLVEMIVVIILTALTVFVSSIVITKSIETMNEMEKNIAILDEAIGHFDYYFTKIYTYARSFGGHVDTISINATEIHGKVYVLNKEHDASLIIRNSNGKSELVWRVNTEEQIIVPYSANIQMYFITPEVSVVNTYGAGVFVLLNKKVIVKDKEYSLRRKVFVPFVNVR